ncbi:hypothetical protein H632_c3137p0, partial [Helicosporidium sp. ATCC 50920]
MFCWGSNQFGQVGSGSSQPTYTTPSPVANPRDPAVVWVDMALGEANSCALTDTNRVFCWGRARDGTNGNDNLSNNMYSPDQADAGDLVNQLYGHGNTMYALTPSGGMYAWGLNDQGQSGNPSYLDAQLKGGLFVMSNILMVVSGPSFAMAFQDNDGVVSLLSWGGNERGQLGLGSADAVVRQPTPIVPPAGFMWRTYSFGLYVWGNNSSGALASADSMGGIVSTPMFNPLEFSSIAGGFSC